MMRIHFNGYTLQLSFDFSTGGLLKYLRTPLDADGFERNGPKKHVEWGLLEMEPGVCYVAAPVEVQLAKRRAALKYAPHNSVVHLFVV